MKKSIILFIIFLILGMVSYIIFNTMISSIFFIISSISITYYFYTKKDTIKDITESNTKLISFVLTFILLAVVFFYISFFIKNHIDLSKNKIKDYESPVELVAISTYSESDAELSLQSYKSQMKDTSLVIVKNNSDISLRSSTLEKYEGDSTNCDYSNLYGLNALYLNKSGSHSLLNTVTITSEVKCGIPLFAAGEKSIIDIEDSKVVSKSYNDTAAVSVTQGGEINGNNVTILTKGKNSPALRILDNSSINLQNSLLSTNSSNSPIIYTDGLVTLKNVTGTSDQSQMLYLKDKGEVNIESSSFLTGGRGDSIDSHSAINITGENTLRITDSTININNKNLYYEVSSMFYIKDAKTNIYLTNSSFNTGSNIFLKSINSNIKIDLKDEDIKGDIINTDSNIELNLVNSKYTGDLNGVSLTLDENSHITLTKDTTLKELHNKVEDNSNIDLNGYNLTVK